MRCVLSIQGEGKTLVAYRNRDYDPPMMDPEQTKGVMQDVLRQKMAGTLDGYAPPAEPALPGYPYQTQTNFMRGWDLKKGEEFMEDPMAARDPESALAFSRMQAAWQRHITEAPGYLQHGRKPLYLTQANRTIEEQLKAHGKKDTPENREWARGMTHVLGQGFDINQFNPGTGLKDYRGARHQWMRENAAKFGFHWPGYQEKKAVRKSGVPRPGFTSVPEEPGYERRPEWWHWNYNPVKAAEGHAPIPEWSKVKEAPPVAAAAGATSSIGT